MSKMNALALHEDQSADGVFILTNRHEETKRLAQEIMLLHPAYVQLKNKLDEGTAKRTMMQVASMAVLHGANPLPASGEIQVWADWQGNVSTYLGIPYFRRMMQQNGGYRWVWEANVDVRFGGREASPRKMTKDEQIEYGAGKDDLGFVCKGYRLDEYQQAVSDGMAWQIAQHVCSQVGIGVIRYSEMFATKKTRYRDIGDPLPPPNGRSWEWVAAKRAERDLLLKLSPTASMPRADVVTLQVEPPAGENRPIDDYSDLFGDDVSYTPRPPEAEETPPDVEIIDAEIEIEESAEPAPAHVAHVDDEQGENSAENPTVDLQDGSDEEAVDSAEQVADRGAAGQGETAGNESAEQIALNARSLHEFVKAVEQLPFGHVFGNVEKIEKACKYLCHDEPFTMVPNQLALDTMRRCANAIIDDVSKREAANAARKYFSDNYDESPF